MGAARHTPLSALLAIAATACSFDTTEPLFGESGDAGFLSADARPAADGQRSLTADGAPATGPDAAPPLAAGTLQSFSLSTPLTLDGDLDAAWLDHSFVSYDIDEAGQLLAVQGYVADAKLRFASRYDASNIYFFLEVTDDLLNTNSSNVYQDDSIEIYIDGLNDRSGPYGNDDHWLVVGEEGTYQSLGPANLPLSGFIKATADGYNVEISVERADLGGAATATTLGFNVGLNDDDDMAGPGIDAYGLWHLPTTPECSTCCTDETTNFAWCDTTRLGQLELVP